MLSSGIEISPWKAGVSGLLLGPFLFKCGAWYQNLRPDNFFPNYQYIKINGFKLQLQAKRDISTLLFEWLAINICNYHDNIIIIHRYRKHQNYNTSYDTVCLENIKSALS